VAGESVTYRLRRNDTLLIGAIGVGGAGVGVAFLTGSLDHISYIGREYEGGSATGLAWFSVLFGLGFMVPLAVRSMLPGQPAVEMDERGLTVRFAWRTRFAAWGEISDVGPVVTMAEPFSRERPRFLVVRTRSGESFRVPLALDDVPADRVRTEIADRANVI
jgi:hypothetical protein